MSVRYRLVQWNAFKVRYDLVVCTGIAAFVGTFLAAAAIRPVQGQISPPVLLIRALGACAYLMLHVVLCIGPLARLDRRFLPLLYNRRHLGVATFLVALTHGMLAVGFYHGFSETPALVSLLTSNVNYGSLTAFPFETLGVVALAILFLMAATSHDLWLKTLTPGVWKSLHMLVYVAWAAASVRAQRRLQHTCDCRRRGGRGPAPCCGTTRGENRPQRRTPRALDRCGPRWRDRGTAGSGRSCERPGARGRLLSRRPPVSH
jgi:DMSO/TMAO reductase YedYZ heme-binding membrane subunit